jgi:hypothetical protein
MHVKSRTKAKKMAKELAKDDIQIYDKHMKKIIHH